jgi:hypothetical protein
MVLRESSSALQKLKSIPARFVEDLTSDSEFELQSSPITPIREVTAQPFGLMTLPASIFPAITEKPLKLRRTV